jgi:hypothetical protein
METVLTHTNSNLLEARLGPDNIYEIKRLVFLLI